MAASMGDAGRRQMSLKRRPAPPVAPPEPRPRHRPLRTAEGLGLEITAAAIAFAIALTVVGHVAGGQPREAVPASGAKSGQSPPPFARR